MSDTERLGQALRAMREADAERSAPAFLETRLRAEFRARHAPRARFRWAWVGALAMASAVAFVVWQLAVPFQVEAPKSVAVSPAPVQSPAPVAQPVQPPPATVVAVAKKRPAPAKSAVPAAVPVDVTTASAREESFMALPYAPPFTRTDSGQVMRVRIGRQTLRQWGLPVNEERIMERVPADLLVGEDGIPRAIRIVNVR